MKDFRLFKQRPTDAHLCFEFTFHGARYKRCLETGDKNEAQRRARAKYKEITGAVLREDYPTLMASKLRSDSGSVSADTFYEHYRQSPVDASADTKELNIHALKQLLDTCYNGAAKTLAMITGDVASTWFAKAGERANAEPDPAEQTTIKRSANSRATQAASLCTPKALDWYKRKGLPIDGLEDFARTALLGRFSKLAPIHYNPPPEAQIAKMLGAWEALPDGPLFRAVGLALAFGLRREEISQARWDWFSQRSGYPVVDSAASGISVRVKNKTCLVQVRALDPFYTILRSKARPADGETNVINGTPTYVWDVLYRDISDWIRDIGWKTRKHAHALRAYAGSLVAMKYGIYEAQIFLRHSSVKVTEDHYSYFVHAFRPANLDDVPAQWATGEPKVPVLRILDAAAS